MWSRKAAWKILFYPKCVCECVERARESERKESVLHLQDYCLAPPSGYADFAQRLSREWPNARHISASWRFEYLFTNLNNQQLHNNRRLESQNHLGLTWFGGQRCADKNPREIRLFILCNKSILNVFNYLKYKHFKWIVYQIWIILIACISNEEFSWWTRVVYLP